MTEPGDRLKLPWGLILAVAVLAAALVLIYRLTPSLDNPAPWPGTIAAVGLGVAGFFIIRWLQNYSWGLLAGLLIPLHPLVREAAQGGQPFFSILFSESLGLIVLAAVLGAWRITFHSFFAWRSWLFGVLVLGQGLGLAWCLEPRIGLGGSLVTCVGLLMVALFAALLHRHGKVDAPSWGNIGLAVLVGLAVPTGALILGPPVFRAFGGQTNPIVKADSTPLDLVQAGLGGSIGEYQLHGFRWEDLSRWAWPEVWLVLALMALGFLRSVWRGWKLWGRSQAPAAWLFTIYTLVAMAGACFHAGPNAMTGYLTLASLTVLLSIYGIADLLRGFLEKLVLAPPQERE